MTEPYQRIDIFDQPGASGIHTHGKLRIQRAGKSGSALRLSSNRRWYSSGARRYPGGRHFGGRSTGGAPAARLPELRLRHTPGGNKSRLSPRKLPAPRDAAAYPESGSDSGSRCTSAGRAQRRAAIAAVAASLVQKCTWRRPEPADLHLLGHQVAIHLVHQQVDDLDQVVVGQRGEQKSLRPGGSGTRIERLLHFAAHHFFDLGGHASPIGVEKPRWPRFFEEPRAQVRSHDDDGVLEVHLGCPGHRSTGRLRTPCSRML